MKRSVAENLIRYGLFTGVLKDADGVYNTDNAESFGLQKVFEEGKTVVFTVENSNGTEETEPHRLVVGPAEDSLDKAGFSELYPHMPLVEVADLIGYALECKVVSDYTDGKKFLSYNGDYIKLSKADVFEFSIRGESIGRINLYKVTFNRDKAKDIRKKIEYASRASRFIDALVQRIMTHYNILIVAKASLDEKSFDLPSLPVSADFALNEGETEDSEKETSTIQSQIKVLIRYRDTADNKSFSETVIDDVYVTFEENGFGGSEAKFSDKVSIIPHESEALYNEISPSADEFRTINLVKNYVEKDKSKIEIFQALRNNPNSKLNKLIEQRTKVYKNDDKAVQKVEFTLTPLSIYSNHITSKTKRYILKSAGTNRFFVNSSCEYEFTFDPMSKDARKYTIEYTDENGEKKVAELNKSNPLVCVVKNDFRKDGAAVLQAACAKSAVKLSDVNPEIYGTADYEGVYALKTDIEKIGEKQYLTFECRYCQVDGRRYHKSDMAAVAFDHILSKTKTADNPSVINARYKRICSNCGAEWGASAEIWNGLSAGKFRLINSQNGASCCNDCIGTVLKDKASGKVNGIFRDGRGFSFLDNAEFPENTVYCAVCGNDKKSNFKRFAYTSKVEGESELKFCAVCGKYYCNEHMPEENYADGKPVCSLCAPKLKDVEKYSDFSGAEGLKLWQKISYNLSVSDRKKKICAYLQSAQELRVYCVHAKHIKTYYFYASENGKIYILKKVFKVKIR